MRPNGHPERRADPVSRRYIKELEKILGELTELVARQNRFLREARARRGLAAGPIPPPSTQCSGCIHLNLDGHNLPTGDQDLEPAHVHACAAFPEGIPEQITEQLFDHRKEWDVGAGDGGIRFEPTDAKAAQVVNAIDFEAGR